MSRSQIADLAISLKKGFSKVEEIKEQSAKAPEDRAKFLAEGLKSLALYFERSSLTEEVASKKENYRTLSYLQFAK